MNKRLISTVATLMAVVAMIVPTGVALALTSTAIYDSTPSPLPPNLPSLGYQATSTQEFGDYIQFASTNRNLTTVTVTMSDWALQSDYPLLTDGTGWDHPITLNIYQVVSGPTPAAGALIATTTQIFHIPWRPVADPTCPGGTAWRAADTQCYNGLAFNITFDLTSLNLVLPNAVIYGIAYNTQTHGYAPMGVPGPYNSLNVGLNTGAAPTVGTDVDPDAVFWNTSHGPFYTDGGAGGVGTFRQDTAWAPYVPAVQFNATEPPVGPPTNKDQCKNNGWKTFNTPKTFKNQGDCIQYVNTGK